MRISLSSIVAAGITLPGFLAGLTIAGEAASIDGFVLTPGTGVGVSGSHAECISLVGTPVLLNQKGRSLNVDGDSRFSSDYKKSFYAPDITLQASGNSWTWSISFTALQDVSLEITQVAFFSCDKSMLSRSTCPYDYTISYTMALEEGGDTLSTAVGSVVLEGAESASCARYDLVTGDILEGSGGIAMADWGEAVPLLAGHTYTYTMTVTGETLTGTYSIGAGFGAVQFIPAMENRQTSAFIPEPASTVLALPAFALLIWRRRRTHASFT